MIPKITRRSFAIGLSAMAVTAVAGNPPAQAVPANAKTAFSYFKRHGYTAIQSAGIVGNLMQESQVNPRAVQRNGPGRGIAQWGVNSRWRNLVSFARSKKVSEWRLDIQLAFIIRELNSYPYYGKRQLKAAKTLWSATKAFSDHYERPGIPMLSKRVAYAIQVYPRGVGGSGLFPVLRKGNRGSAVKTMQYLMTSRGYSLRADGAFGSGTFSRVRSFQRSRRLSVDGIVGAKTWGRLLVTLRQGSKGSAVKALQAELNATGSRLRVDGRFGPVTKRAVRSYQKKRRLAVDGIVGYRTWGALID